MYDEIGQENFAGERGMGNYTGIDGDRPIVSEATQKAIDEKVKTILREQYERAIRIIRENLDLHTKISEDLLVQEEMDRATFDAYFA